METVSGGVGEYIHHIRHILDCPLLPRFLAERRGAFAFPLPVVGIGPTCPTIYLLPAAVRWRTENAVTEDAQKCTKAETSPAIP